jgi:phosphoribosylaminoimidazolecarboxamide formyltransferase/IMP cyclohydrolase
MAGVPVKRRRRALLSVTDKRQLEDVAILLHSFEYELVASGGTAGYLREHRFEVTDVSDITGFPEIFGGRVKTLHPAIHGGILGKSLQDFDGLDELHIAPFDLVVVNLYRFADTLARGASADEAVEQIDIGGPTLLRAAAKNYQRVTVVSGTEQYEELLHELRANDGEPSLEFRRRMAAAVFRRVARYDEAIAAWLETEAGVAPADAIALRYGENPHQGASLLLPAGPDPAAQLAAVGLTQHSGKELSYNNIVDLVAAVKLVLDFDEPSCAVIKHTNPCGFGFGDAATALDRALLCDPVSAFGGVFAFNQELSPAAADTLAKRFLEIVAAPAFDEAALAKLRKKKNVRVLTVDPTVFARMTEGKMRAFGQIVLHQDEDAGFPELDRLNVVAGEPPDAATAGALAMVWKVCKHGKSNAIVLGNEHATIGVGFGQMSRVDSVKLAIAKAGEQGLDLAGAVAASDGFFPFPDGIETLAAAGIRAVIAPGGSIRDAEVAAAARELGLTLVLADRRHFNH